MTQKVLLLNKISESARNIFEKNKYIIEEIDQLSPSELKEKIKEVNIIGIRSKTQLTKDILQNATNLLAIGHFCIGTDQTNLDYASQLGIPVFNSPYQNTRSVSELVIGYMIMLSRKLGDRSSEMHNGIWNKTSKSCNELRGKTLGIIGYGSIGSQLSVLAEMMGLKVIFYDIIPKLHYNNAIQVKSLDELLESSDFVSLHVPLTNRTKNMINQYNIMKMNKGCYLINASRGSVVDIHAVSIALNEGHLGGAAFDVFPEEPKQYTEKIVNSLQNCPNTILTPHIGGSTTEALHNIGIDVATKLVKYVEDGITFGAINFPQIDLPRTGLTRIVNIHQNKPGALKSFNKTLKDVNISNQVLSTYKDIGFTITEIDNTVSDEIINKINSLEHNLNTRIL